MKTWVVTGANRGIGLELCRQIVQRGDEVFAACRVPSRELDGLGERARVVPGVDVTDDRAAEPILAATEGRRVDVLVQNAGILLRESLDALDFDGMQKQFATNALGPLRITAALLPRLDRGSKIALVSSRVGSITDNGSGGLYGYRMSKAALNMAGVTLARDLAPRGIHVVLLHPGFIRTDMTGQAGNDEPETAAKGMLARIDVLDASMSGRFYHANGEELPW